MTVEPRALQLADLLQLWLETRAPEVSEAIEAQAPRLARPLSPKSANGLRRQARWLAACVEPDQATFTTLCESLHGGFSSDVSARLRIVATWPDDPRVSSALVAMWERPSHLNVSTAFLWRELSAALVARADARSLQRLEAVQAMGAGWVRLFKPHMRPLIPALLDEASKALRLAVKQWKVRPLTEAERKRLRDSKPAAGHADLLAAVYAHPRDRSLREVYGDWLSAQADPRGEFIALQCLEKRTIIQSRRMAQLLREHGKKWLGPLAGVVEVVEWQHGFPSSVIVSSKSSMRVGRMVGHPAWSTVLTLSPRGYPPVIAHPSMQHLLRWVVWPSDLNALLRLGGPYPVRSIVFPSADGLKCFRAIAKTTALPQLSEVIVQRDVHPADKKAALDLLSAARPQVRVVFTRAKLAPPARG